MYGQVRGSKKVREGDAVVVISGNAKGQKGVVKAIHGDRVVVGGVNMAKKHVKKSQASPNGGFADIERPIHVSNVCPCDAEGNRLKVRVRVNTDGERDLVYQKDGQSIVWRSIKRRQK